MDWLQGEQQKVSKSVSKVAHLCTFDYLKRGRLTVIMLEELTHATRFYRFYLRMHVYNVHIST